MLARPARFVLLPVLLLTACVETTLAPYPVTPLAKEGPLRDGTQCDDTQVPAWQIDATTRTARLADDSVSVQLPAHLLTTQERADLLVLSGPRSGNGPQPRFELLVTPRCQSVNARTMLQRMAARALSHRYKPEEISTTFAAHRAWDKKFDGNREQIAHGDLLLRDAEVSLTLVSKPVAMLQSYDVVLNAGCPRYEEPGRRCLRDQLLLTKGVTIVAPPATPTPTPTAEPTN